MTSHSDVESATAELVDYLRQRAPEIGRLLARRYREEIVEYRSLPDGFMEQDVIPTAQRNLEAILSEAAPDQSGRVELDYFRDSAIRRFQQGLPIQALLQSYRLWGHTVWDEVMKAPLTEQHPEAALVLAGRIMKHVDVVSTTVAQAYLQKATGIIHDREMIRRDLIEALVTGNAPDRIANHAPTFKLADNRRYFVVLLRAAQLGRATAPDFFRTGVEAVEAHFDPRSGAIPIAAVRGEEIVAVCDVEHYHHEDLRAHINDLAAQLAEFVVGVGRPHVGFGGIGKSYVDAQDAILSAGDFSTSKPRAYLFTDALLDHVLRTSSYRDDLYNEAIAPLRRYDDAHSGELLPTLRAFIDTGFSLAQAAHEQHVQPNTIKYRLQRIHSLTGYNPMHPRDVVLFALALNASTARR